jgi:hypothetical protein
MAEKGKQASAPPTLTNRDHELIVNALSSVKGGVLTVSIDGLLQATTTTM